MGLKIQSDRRQIQSAIQECGRGSELGTTVKQIQLAVRAELELGATELQVQRTNHSTTLPPNNRKLFLIGTI